MSLFTRFPLSQTLLFGGLAILLYSSPLHAQDLRKWMPNVGDKFITRQVIDGTIEDTISIVIVQVDTVLDSANQHVVVTESGMPGQNARLEYYSYFHAGDSTSALPNFIVRFLSSPVDSGGLIPLFNFSTALDTSFSVEDVNYTGFLSGFGEGDMYTQEYGSAFYISQFKWFAFLYGEMTYTHGIDTSSLWFDRYILSAISAVNEKTPTQSFPFQIDIDGSIIYLDLSQNIDENCHFLFTDLLGRPVRAWSMDIDAAEREVSLNVADVPSGVYFLHVTAAGVDEMRKVVIVH